MCTIDSFVPQFEFFTVFESLATQKNRNSDRALLRFTLH